MLTLLNLDNLPIPLRAERITPIQSGYLLQGKTVALLHPFEQVRFYRHGWHSWSLTSWIPLPLDLQKPQPEIRWPMIDHPKLLADYPFTGSGVGALQAPDGKILLLGALGLDGFISADEITLRGVYPYASPGLQVEWFLAYGEEQLVFAAYADQLGQRLGVRCHEHPPRVWCSWYGLYGDIYQDILLDALAGLSGLPFDVFQIDDGWQISLGDWQANAKFPNGMAWMAEKIQRAGLTPGLWLAPLAVAPASSIYQQHPDWLLHGIDGRPLSAGHNWGDFFYGLDTTHPEVQSWLYDLIETARSWGYKYLKLDFLYAGAMPGVRYENIPAEQAYRIGLEVIRQAAGDAYFLACGSPIFPAIGLADALRVGSDVAPYWDNPERTINLHDLTGVGSLNAIRTALHRLWLRPLIDVDPDVAFFRTRFNLMFPEQSRLLQDLAQIAGFLATSDLPAWLDPHERQSLLDFLQASPKIVRLDRYRFQINQRLVDFSFIEDVWRV
jgi:alpha-galactosidase